jgi:hypothetical protein
MDFYVETSMYRGSEQQQPRVQGNFSEQRIEEMQELTMVLHFL